MIAQEFTDSGKDAEKCDMNLMKKGIESAGKIKKSLFWGFAFIRCFTGVIGFFAKRMPACRLDCQGLIPGLFWK
jgi:hypothetical protein